MADPIDARARQARATLERQLLAHPAVRLIDIGREDAAGAADRGSIILRVHVRTGEDRSALRIPAEVDGFPVRVVAAGDYRPE